MNSQAISSAITSNETHYSTVPKLANWTFRQCGTDSWLPASVPGCNFTDLIDNQLISDPFYGDEESQLQWIEKQDWEYQVEFNVNEQDLKADELLLAFKGLDTYCDIYLNDVLLSQTNNMFVGYEFFCKKLLKQGTNKLHLVFHSPINQTMPLMQENGFIYPAENDKSTEKLSVYSRKAPYHFGWDWGPRFVVSGIWRDIEFIPIHRARVNNVFVQQVHQDGQVQLNIQSEVSNINSKQLTLVVRVNGEDYAEVKTEVQISKGHTQVVQSVVTITEPQLWWPNGLGDAHLYNLEIILLCDGQVVDCHQQKIGLRTIELINSPDDQGVSFYFKVNGHHVFMKGANYIPSDSFLNRVDKHKYQQIFADTVSANMNMLRVWGGGVYEDDYFYELADQSGILIWQDFMFACTLYPADEEFLDNVALEVKYNIKRLRNHACIALWCGNNEIEMGIECWEWSEKFSYSDDLYTKLKLDYQRLFKELLANLVEQFHPNTQYISSSPISFWENPEDDDKSDNHYWGVWHGELPFSTFKDRVPRFMSEYGFQSFPMQSSIEQFASSEEQHLRSPTMLTHQKHPRGNGIIERHMLEEFNQPNNFAAFTYLSQIIQAQALRVAFSAHRGAKPFCMGTLYWQFNDCWPATSWSSIDYFGRWKALHYQAKKSFKPVIIFIEEQDNGLSIKAVSDLKTPIKLDINIQLMTFNGDTLFAHKASISMAANGSNEVTKLDPNMLVALHTASGSVLQVECDTQGIQLDAAQHYFVRSKHLTLEKPEIKTSFVIEDGALKFELISNTLARYVHIELPGIAGNFSDNFFDLMPNQAKTVFIKLPNSDKIDPTNILGDLSMLSLYDTYLAQPADNNSCS